MTISSSSSSVASARGFFSHLRPARYDARLSGFSTTLFLGFLAVFFLVLETITGIFLVIYYVPSVDGAYGSVVRIMSEIPFGWLIRDLHRLGGDMMVGAVVLHMFWVFIRGGYRGEGRYGWWSGIFLLFFTLVLEFSGYLLPWDQLAYWAVTIGTSLADAIPGFGHQLKYLLRGGAELDQDGLLRFYLIHIVAVPGIAIILSGMHYYQVVRARRRATPLEDPPVKRVMLPLFPAIVMRELVISILLFAALVVVSLYWYDAPLESHANPLHTPAQTAAPWMFLWLQGGLKLGDIIWVLLAALVAAPLLLASVPLLDRSRVRPGRKRYGALGLSLCTAAVLGWLSILGQPDHSTVASPVSQLLLQFSPEERQSPFHKIPFDGLVIGVYRTDGTFQEANDGDFFSILEDFKRGVAALGKQDDITDVQGVIIVEPWQDKLKRVSVKVSWRSGAKSKPMVAERELFVHGDNSILSDKGGDL